MLKSMTGFGRAIKSFDGYVVTVEIKSVNHRYFDFSSRVQRQYGFLEEKLKNYVNRKISRGKTECFVSIESDCAAADGVSINIELAGAYVNALRTICKTYNLDDSSIDSCVISKFPDVLTVSKPEEDEEKIWDYTRQTLDEALDKFVEMRIVEGKKLYDDIFSRSQIILSYVEKIEERSPQTVKQYNDKLKERVHELIGDVSLDEERIIQEVAIYADKVAVSEETVRLRSHIDQLKEFLLSEEPVGRKMDFLVQEINREANTIGSKANDIDIAKTVVEIKAEVEKIREQIQNLE